MRRILVFLMAFTFPQPAPLCGLPEGRLSLVRVASPCWNPRLHAKMVTSDSVHKSLRVFNLSEVIVVYIFFLMLKFFKRHSCIDHMEFWGFPATCLPRSFKANRRLNVVIMTLTHSMKDVSHFAIVFLTIFLCCLAFLVSQGDYPQNLHTANSAHYFCWLSTGTPCQQSHFWVSSETFNSVLAHHLVVLFLRVSWQLNYSIMVRADPQFVASDGFAKQLYDDARCFVRRLCDTQLEMIEWLVLISQFGQGQ